MRTSIIIIITMLFSSCSLFDREQLEKDEDGAIIDMDPLWVNQFTDKPNGHGRGMRSSVAKGGYTLFIRHFNGQDEFVWVEAETGKDKWVWDGVQRKENNIQPDNVIVNEDNISLSKVHFFQLDMNTGNPNVYFTRDDGIGGGQFERFTKIGDKYYCIRTFEEMEDGKLSSVIYQVDDQNKQLSFFLEPLYPMRDVYSTVNGLNGAIMNIKSYRANGKDYLVMVFTDIGEQVAGNHKSNIHIALYNLKDERWEYDAETVTTNTEFNAGAFMEVYKGRVYLNHDRQIYCYDILSGEMVWKQNFEGIFFIGGFTLGEGMIVANCEEAFTYGVEPETGEILWKVPSGGSTSPIAIMNGVAYFSGGSDGRLNAIDIQTGRYIWKLKRPGSSNWKRHVAVVPGDGSRPDLIVASTYKEYMAFPAAR